jgi:hypothetical protein
MVFENPFFVPFATLHAYKGYVIELKVDANAMILIYKLL